MRSFRPLALSLLIALAAVPGRAGEPSGDAERREGGRKYFTDVVLVDQDGKQVRLYSDLVEGKTIVVSSFFATCNGICPVMAGTLRKVQSALGDRLGRDVLLISISVDPENDTPQRLQEFAKNMAAGPGWRFLTGDKKNVEQALHKFGLKTEMKENHTSIVIVGNEPKGVWKKVFGLAPSDEVQRLVQEVATAQ
ncbi:MAG: SCO family protein [Thermoanaerobaculia bacterium]